MSKAVPLGPILQHVTVIAEAGINHNGSVDRACQMIDVAARAGADVVKFQTFKVERLLTSAAPKAEYQRERTGGGESQLEMLRKTELDARAHKVLQKECQAKGVEFLSTPFDLESVDLLVHDLGLSRLKIPSGEITNAPLLLKIAQSDKPVILSTGMCTLADVRAALGVLAFGYLKINKPPGKQAFQAAFEAEDGKKALERKVSLLHCTTQYPTPFDQVNLRAMDTLRDTFQLPVGYSDHTPGIAVAVAAAARGATIIEKHFTLDRNLPGPDHQASIEPGALADMVASIRAVEVALGSGGKTVADVERANIQVARKSLVAARSIEAGERFSEDNLTAKRPGGGRSPLDYWSLLGQPASRSYKLDEAIEE